MLLMNLLRRSAKCIFCILILLTFWSCGAAQETALHTFDPFTKEPIVLETVDRYIDGTKLTKEKCDGVIFVEKNGRFYKRRIDNILNVRWFGAKGDGDVNDLGTDDTNAIKKALSIIAELYPIYDLSGGNYYGGATLYFPNGKYLIDETLILPDGITILGESQNNTVLHSKKNRFIFSNIRGFDKNGVDVLMSSQIFIREITLTQGGVELQGATNSELRNMRILNLSGPEKENVVGLLIKLSVNLKISDVKIFNSSGYGILFEDSAGSGPSTTVMFNNIWITHCKVGLRIDGLAGGAHGILNSRVYNSIFEYNEVGMEIAGNIENLAIRDIHFEQNKRNALEIDGDVNLIIDNAWSDKGNILLKNRIHKGNVKNRVFTRNVVVPSIEVDRSFRGEIVGF